MKNKKERRDRRIAPLFHVFGVSENMKERHNRELRLSYDANLS